MFAFPAYAARFKVNTVSKAVETEGRFGDGSQFGASLLKRDE